MLGWLIEALSALTTFIIEASIWLLNFLFSGLFYSILNTFLKLTDFIQLLFKKLAGLDTFYVDGVSYENQDILSYIFASDIIVQTFISLVIVAVFLLGLFTFIQIIRVEYTTEGSKNSKGNIVSQSLKSLAMFIIVPVSCLIGVFFSNVLLRMLNTATAGSSTTTIGGLIFKSAAYDANYIRRSQDSGKAFSWGGWEWLYSIELVLFDSSALVDDVTTGPRTSTAKIVVVNGEAKFQNEYDYNAGGWDVNLSGYELANEIDNTFASGTKQDSNNMYLSYSSPSIVGYYYNLTKIDYVIGIAAACMALVCLLKASFGMILRLYKATILFVVSPPIVAITPLDNGKAFQGWRQQFIGAVLSGYGTVVGLNLFFVVMGILMGIDLFSATDTSWMFPARWCNNITQLLFVLVGCFSLKNMTKLVSDLIGAEDAVASGDAVAKQVGGLAKDAGKVAFGAGMLGIGAGKGLVNRMKAGSINKKSKKHAEKVNALNYINNFATTKGLIKDGKFNQDAFMGMKPEDRQKFVNSKEMQALGFSGEASDVGSFFNSNYGSYKDEDGNEKQGFLGKFSDSALVDEQSGIDKKSANLANSSVSARMFGQGGKAALISMVAGTGAGKIFNDMTNNNFKATGGKGFDQNLGLVENEGDIGEKGVGLYKSRKKDKKNTRERRRMGAVGDVIEAADTRKLNNNAAEMGTGNLSEIEAMGLKNAGIVRNCIKDLKSAGSDQDKIAKVKGNYEGTLGSDFVDRLAEKIGGSEEVTFDKDNNVTVGNAKMELQSNVQTEVNMAREAVQQIQTAVATGNQAMLKENLDRLAKDVTSVSLKGYKELVQELQSTAKDMKGDNKQLSKLVKQLMSMLGVRG